MSKQNNQTDRAFEDMFASVEALDDAEVELELRALGIDPGVAGSAVKSAIDRAVADYQPRPREDQSHNPRGEEVALFRDSEEPMFAGRSASLPSARKPKKDSSLN